MSWPRPDVARRLFAPAVVQTSAMDCGPATLKCLLEGFGIPASYGRLREACQTDVDGTSIDTLEEAAIQLGLEAEQIIVPEDHLLLPSAETLPSIVVVQQPSRTTHFVVLWRQHGPFVQIMDPATGRRWSTKQRFLDELYIHGQPISIQTWHEWVTSDGFLAPFRQRLAKIGIDTRQQEQLINQALQDDDWRAAAALDAAVRMVAAMLRGGGLEPGLETSNVLVKFNQRAQADLFHAQEIIPLSFWYAHPLSDPEQLQLRGAVVIRILGHRSPAPSPIGESPLPLRQVEEPAQVLPDLAAALADPPQRPEAAMAHFLREDGLLTATTLTFALALASGGVILEALLLRGLLEFGRSFPFVQQRVVAMVGLLAFMSLLLLLESPITNMGLRFGRGLETRLRTAFLEKIPRLGDRYFHSRLTADMAQRAHDLRQLRSLPQTGIRFLRVSFQIILTMAGIIWIAPDSAPRAILVAMTVIGLPLLAQPVLTEQDLRFRTFTGALGRFYLDALLGLVPLRTHNASLTLRREHESLLVEWVRAGIAFYRVARRQ